MKKFLLVILILSTNLAISQKLNKETLIGQWTVQKVTISDEKLPNEDKQMIEILKQGFLNSNFDFKSDGKFTIEFQEDAPEFMDELTILNNKDWKFNEIEQLISIGTHDDNYNHMRIYVQNKDGKFIFAFSDTPLIMEMIKK